MFRRKDEMFGTGSEDGQGVLPVTQDGPVPPASSHSVATATTSAASASSYQPSASTRAMPEASRNAVPTASAFRPGNPAHELLRPRGPEAQKNPASSTDKAKGNRRVLTVGHDILLKGEIATCDRLVIEGKVDASLNEVHTVEIAETGSFKGTAQIEDAEISGLFEGDLVVRNRLVIYSTGKVRGKITYGEIEIERGGELTGEIKTTTAAGASSQRSGQKSKAEAA